MRSTVADSGPVLLDFVELSANGRIGSGLIAAAGRGGRAMLSGGLGDCGIDYVIQRLGRPKDADDTTFLSRRWWSAYSGVAREEVAIQRACSFVVVIPAVREDEDFLRAGRKDWCRPYRITGLELASM